MRWIACSIAILAVLGGFAPFSQAATPSQIRVGYSDPSFSSSDAPTRNHWLDKAAAAGGTLERINVYWSTIAPLHPDSNFVGSDPSSPGYRWESLDGAVRSAAAHGMTVMLTVLQAPSWAEGRGRPDGARAGTWRPQPALFASFGMALARRYSGSYPDPLASGSSLPRVRFYEVWNEPNQDEYLGPQWEGGKLVGPGIYRNLLNRFYAAVKKVQPHAKILGGSMSPFGDSPGGPRTPPVVFLREMLCLKGGRLRRIRCPKPAHLDILSDHPITFGAPFESARSPLDVSTPNLGRLTRILRRAEQSARVLPAGHRPLWATEFWYVSDPPQPGGVPLAKQARWYEQALYVLWLGGASALVLQPIRDQPSLPSGIYFEDGSPKPSRQAMRFPFVTQRIDRETVRAWGIAPHRGTVRIQVGHRGSWRTLASVRTPGRSHPFLSTLHLPRGGELRARIGGTSSLTWKQG